MKAIWKDVVLAESDDTISIEGNHYFPRESLKDEFFEESAHKTTCAWKGEASYLDVVVNGDRNSNAAWYYPSPSQMARGIKDRVAFWHGVEVVKEL